MSKKIIIIAILSIVIFFPVLSFGADSFCREVPLPNLSNLPGFPKNFQGPCVGPAEYVIYWFYFSIYLAGLIAFFAIVASGVIRLFQIRLLKTHSAIFQILKKIQQQASAMN